MVRLGLRNLTNRARLIYPISHVSLVTVGTSTYIVWQWLVPRRAGLDRGSLDSPSTRSAACTYATLGKTFSTAWRMLLAIASTFTNHSYCLINIFDHVCKPMCMSSLRRTLPHPRAWLRYEYQINFARHYIKLPNRVYNTQVIEHNNLIFIWQW